MSVVVVIALGLLGGAGAVGRFLLDGRVSVQFPMTFPIGTFAVNVLGAFALGVLAGATTDEDLLRVVGVGFLGGFTTFSTWMLETQRLAEDGEGAPAVANVVGSLAAGIPLAWLGLQLGGLL